MLVINEIAGAVRLFDNGHVTVSMVPKAYLERFHRSSLRAGTIEVDARKREDVAMSCLCDEYGVILRSGKVKVEYVGNVNAAVRFTTYGNKSPEKGDFKIIACLRA